MAIISETVNLRVILSNSYGDEKSYIVKNPDEELTLAAVREAFQSALDSDIILSAATAGNPLKSVKSARRIVTTTDELS